MNVRRFEHPTKHRFWEVYWDLSDVEIVTGKVGSSGRATRREFNSPMACAELVQREIAQRIAEGFEEVVPEVIKNRSAPQATPPAALMQRIVEAPDDDQPRMVLADWLQQQGDPLGELIAVQLEIARVEPGKTVPKRLRDREDSLLASFRSRWLPEVVGVDVRFVRGFVESVKLELPFERELLERVVAASPLLRTLVLGHPRDGWRWTLQRAWALLPPDALRRLTGLWIGGFELDDAGLDVFLNADLPRLDRLGVRSMQMRPSQLKRLADRAWRELDLHANSLGTRGVEYLVAHDRTALRVLDLASNDIGDGGLALLASVPMPALRTLSVRRSKLTARCLPSLARLSQLEVLEISHNKLEEAAVREALPNVRLVARVKNVG